MLNSPNRRLEIGDMIYEVVFDPFINDRPEWFIIPYRIKDIYYTDACYAELEFNEDGKMVTKKIILSKDSLEDCFYTYEKAEEHVEYLRNRTCSYAWGYNNHKDQEGTVGDTSYNDGYELTIVNLDDEEEKETVCDKIRDLAITAYNIFTEKLMKAWEEFTDGK